MECFSIAVVVIAIVVLIAVQRQGTAARVQAQGFQAQQIEGLRMLVVRLEKRILELERAVGIGPAPQQPVEAAPAVAPPPEPAVPVPPPPARPSSPGPFSQPPPLPPGEGETVEASPSPAPPPPPAWPAFQPPPARPAAGLEERLGARLPVWIGSIALALAGAFLVKYSFEQGWLSPVVRVSLGVLFGIVLLAAGERLRRPSPGIAQGLAAAGIADLFACFLAAVHLYELISPAAGFFFMVLTTAVAVLLSLRHGMMVALIGMIGGFLTPALIRMGDPNARNLFAYLFLLIAGLLAVSHRRGRGWELIGAAALGAGLLWVLFWLGGPFQAVDAPWLSLFLLASAGAAVAKDLLGEKRAEPWMSQAMLAAALLALAATAGRSGYSTVEWVFLAVLAGGTLILARLQPRFEALAWVAAAVPAGLLALWGSALEDAQAGRFLRTALGMGALLAVGGYLAHRGAARPGMWASLSAAAGVTFFVIAWFFAPSELERPWGGIALGIAASYLAAAVPLARARAERPELSPALAALAVAVTTFVSLAVPLEMERQWWTVAWAIEVPALIWLAGRLRLPLLLRLASLLAVGAAARLLLNPLIFTYPTGDHLVLNWLVYGYGLSILAFAFAARLAREQGEDGLADQLEGGAVAFGFVLVTLEVRQFFHPGKPEALAIGLGEWSTLAAAWLLLGWGLVAANRELGRKSLDLGGRTILALGAGLEIAGPVLIANPLWSHEAVGETRIFNLLLWAYGIPALLAALATWELRRREPSALGRFLAGLALALVFLLVTFQVRQAFHGAYLDAGPATVAEQYAYSAAWILLGILFLTVGVLQGGKTMRYASLAVMLLAVGKVFLYDTANLSDLYRVFSFLGLGVSLLFLAWLYQRFVFREAER
jgi:uncharacterized membrane protein